MKMILPVCAAALLLAASFAAQADTFYTSASAWNAAVTGITDVTFEGIADPNSFVPYAGTTTVNGVTFSTDGALFVIGDNFYGFGVATMSGQGPGTTNTDNLTVALPSGTTAVGLDFFVDPGTITLTLGDGSTDSITAADTPSELFIGATTSSPITSLEISEPFSLAAASLSVDKFSYATALPTAAPEPRTTILLGGMLAVIGFAFRRRRRAIN